MGTPIGYEAPLTDRKEVCDFLFALGFKLSMKPITFAIPITKAKFTWAKMRELGLKLAEEGYFTLSEGQLAYLHARYDTLDFNASQREETLRKWGLDSFRYSIPNDDSYKMLWDGKNVNAKWEVNTTNREVRIILCEFKGNSTLGCLLPTLVDKMSDEDLRDFYRFLVQSIHDFRQEVVIREIERGAAWDFFMNYLGGVDSVPDLRDDLCVKESLLR